MRRPRLVPLLVALAGLPLAGLAGARPVRAQEPPPPVELALEVFGRGRVPANGAWVPLRAVLRNRGPATEVRLEARMARSVRDGWEPVGALVHRTGPLDLPSGRRAPELVMHVPPREEGVRQAGILVRCIGPDGATLTEAALPLDPASDRLLCLVLGDATALDSLDRTRVGRTGEPLEMRPTSPTQLPTRTVGYDPVSSVVLAGADLSSLAPVQVDALRAWIRGGGHLLVTASGSPADDPIAGPLLPCDPGPIEPVPVRALTGPVETASPGERLPLARVRPRDGAVVARSAARDRPVVCWRRLGLGRVTYLAVPDLAALPDTWAGRAILAHQLLPDLGSARRAVRLGVRLGADTWALEAAERGLGQRRPPTFFWIGVVLIVYVVLASAGLYVASRGLVGTSRVRMTAALLAPFGLALLFGGVLYGMALTSQRATAYQKTWSVVRMRADDPTGRVTTYATWFSPTKRVVSLDTGEGTTTVPVQLRDLAGEPALLRLTDPSVLEDVQLQQWSLRPFEVRRGLTEVEPVTVTEPLVVRGRRLSGALALPDSFEWAVLHVGQVADRLPAGGGPVDIATDVDATDVDGRGNARSVWQGGAPPRRWSELAGALETRAGDGGTPSFQAVLQVVRRAAHAREARPGHIGAVLVACGPPREGTALPGGPDLEEETSGTLYVVDLPVRLRRDADGPPGAAPGRVVRLNGGTAHLSLEGGVKLESASGLQQTEFAILHDLLPADDARVASLEVREPSTARRLGGAVGMGGMPSIARPGGSMSRPIASPGRDDGRWSDAFSDEETGTTFPLVRLVEDGRVEIRVSTLGMKLNWPILRATLGPGR